MSLDVIDNIAMISSELATLSMTSSVILNTDGLFKVALIVNSTECQHSKTMACRAAMQETLDALEGANEEREAQGTEDVAMKESAPTGSEGAEEERSKDGDGMEHDAPPGDKDAEEEGVEGAWDKNISSLTDDSQDQIDRVHDNMGGLIMGGERSDDEDSSEDEDTHMQDKDNTDGHSIPMTLNRYNFKDAQHFHALKGFKSDGMAIAAGSGAEDVHPLGGVKDIGTSVGRYWKPDLEAKSYSRPSITVKPEAFIRLVVFSSHDQAHYKEVVKRLQRAREEFLGENPFERSWPVVRNIMHAARDVQDAEGKEEEEDEDDLLEVPEVVVSTATTTEDTAAAKVAKESDKVIFHKMALPGEPRIKVIDGLDWVTDEGPNKLFTIHPNGVLFR